ncbi:MAG TPA: branched-chain amino acid ABC transporter permease, partial [Symbiobacteriaceae bacterium]|nr:branched-chain amino acid ABC transporter permease [Symbiobacteriaceae bacterium]
MNNLAIDLLNGLILGSTYVLVAIGLTLIFGILHIVNLAYGEFYMIGGYLAYVLLSRLGAPLLVTLPLAMIASAALGMVVERVFFRPLRTKPETTMLVASIALGVFLQNVVEHAFGPNPQTVRSAFAGKGIPMFGIQLTMDRLIVIVVTAVLVTALYLFITRTKWGKALRATAQDRDGAWMMGINVDRMHNMTFAVGSALAGAAGVLMAPIFIISPQMGFLPFIKAFTVVILGGLGNVTGAVVGGLLLGMVESFGTVYITSQYLDSL